MSDNSSSESKIDNPHFASVASWAAAEEMLTFRPLQPGEPAGFRLQSLSIFVRDHKQRELPIGERSLEAHYGGFVLTQARKGESEARRWALRVSYGAAAFPVSLAGHEGRAYRLGPEVPPDDIDGRSPAVVVWHDGDMFFLIASGELAVEELIDIAGSIYFPPVKGREGSGGRGGTT